MGAPSGRREVAAARHKINGGTEARRVCEERAHPKRGECRAQAAKRNKATKEPQESGAPREGASEGEERAGEQAPKQGAPTA